MALTPTAADRPRGLSPGNGVLLVRLLAALAQAAVLTLLLALGTEPLRWPGTRPGLFVPLELIAVGIPVLVILGAGRLPVRALAGWAAFAAAALAGFGWWTVARRAPGAVTGSEALLPWLPLVPALAGGFFVLNVLVTDLVGARRWMPAYPRHIDTAWKQALQVVFAAVFVGLLWGVLGLGSGLFQLLNIRAFAWLLGQPPFIFAATSLALALAIHVTDVQPGLIRGGRMVILLLLSWLLPLLAGIVLAFLAALPFTRLQPLWQTHFATLLLMSAAGWLVVLINTAYGDGDAWSGSRVKRAAGVLASLELVPLTVLAAVGLRLRVDQYGWSVARIFAAAGLAVIACYAAGYVAAALLRRTRLLERTNFAAAWGGLALVVLLFSPVADPAHLAVADQVARLHAGRVTPAGFDGAMLTSEGARWGAAAKRRLANDPDAAIAAAARDGFARTEDGAGLLPLEPDQLGRRVTLLPAGHALPAALVHASFGSGPDSTPLCFRPGIATCTIRFVTLVPDRPELALMLDGYAVAVMEQDAPEHWRAAGSLSGPVACGAVRDALRSADPPELVPHPARDLVVAGNRLTLTPPDQVCQSDRVR